MADSRQPLSFGSVGLITEGSQISAPLQDTPSSHSVLLKQKIRVGLGVGVGEAVGVGGKLGVGVRVGLGLGVRDGVGVGG